MLKVECESCKAPYQIDERRVPKTGMKMRCPKCGHSFLVQNPSAGAPEGGGSVPPVPPPPDFDELPAVKGKAGPPRPSPAAAAAPDAGPQQIPSFGGDLDDLDLPALAGDVGLPAAAPKATGARKAPPPAAPIAPPVAAPAPPAGPPEPSFAGFGSLDDDLPAVPGFGEIDFPMAKAPKGAAPVAPAPKPMQASPAPQFGDIGEPTGVGLPAPVARPAGFGAPKAAPKAAPAPAPAPAPAGPPPAMEFGDIDVGLPAAVHRPPPAPKPAAAPPPAPFAMEPDIGLPMAFDGGVGLPMAHGGQGARPAPAAAPAPFSMEPDIGLPMAFDGGVGLPMAHGGHAGLPAPHGGHAGLPMAADGGVGLPMPHGGGVGLPMPHGGGVGLPMASQGGAGLPVPAGAGGGFGALDLPSLMNDLPGLGGPNAFNANLPMPHQGNFLPANAQQGSLLPGQGNLPMPHQGNFLPANAQQGSLLPGQGNLPMAHQGNFLPANAQQGSLLPSQTNLPGTFGELDLPMGPGAFGDFGGDGGGGGGGGGGAYGEPLSLGGGPAAGGLAFGEVDLGASGGSSDSLLPGAAGPQPAISGGFGGMEGSPDAKPTRARPIIQRAGTKKWFVVGGLLAVFVVGGAGLQATPYGAFGHHAISDALHASEWKKTTAQASATARATLAKDLYGDARKTSAELVSVQSKNPRARQLAAYAALTEYAVELRFGVVTEYSAKASYLLGGIPPKSEVPYLLAAQGAREAVSGNFTQARSLLDQAARKDPGDPVQDDIRFVRGEMELAARAPDAAITAFSTAGGGTSPRAHFGLARAYLLKKDREKAEKELEATLSGSPDHVGALLARARLVWATKQDEPGALKDLKSVIEGAAKPNASPGELSQAYSTRGWVYFAGNRATDARNSFDEASKLDARNASALIGQGEVLYADGRYTEAISRFEEATQKSPDDVDAICGSAKTKIALERLQEAKTQLSAARSTFKTEMQVAYWLAKAEEALGNKSVAETEYNVAIALADPALPSSVEPYAALAKLLASQGRSAEALKKLELAKSKLADTPALERAFGDVVAAQGKFDDAIGYYQKALAKNDDNATRFRLGQAYRKMRKLDLAAAEFDKLSAVDKDYPGLSLERGMLFEEAGEVQKALEQFKGALAKAPTDLDLMLRVGAAYVAIGQTEEAIKMLNKVFEQRPNSAEANHFLGRAYLRQGGLQVTAAMPRLRRAAELDPNRAEYHLYVAWAANDAAQPDISLARREVDRALELDSTLADAYWQRGVVNFKQGAVRDAERDLRKALELKPNRIEAHASIAELLEHNNQDFPALAEWAIACTAMPRQAWWRYRYGRLLQEKGKNGEAVGHLTFAVQEALTMQPRPGWITMAAFAAAVSQDRTGKKAEAIENYRLFLQTSPSSSPDREDALNALKKLGGKLPD
jgi:predicted Zn finger-like uncharacterized protein